MVVEFNEGQCDKLFTPGLVLFCFELLRLESSGWLFLFDPLSG